MHPPPRFSSLAEFPSLWNASIPKHSEMFPEMFPKQGTIQGKQPYPEQREYFTGTTVNMFGKEKRAQCWDS